MAEKKGAGGRPQEYNDETGQYVGAHPTKTVEAIRKYSDDPEGDIAEYGNLPSANRLVENYDKKFGNQINIQLFAANYTRQTEKQLEKSLKSHQDNIREHQFKINNPTKFYAKWETMTQIERDGRLQQWEKEIKNFQNQVSKIEEELNKRRKANGSERNH